MSASLTGTSASLRLEKANMSDADLVLVEGDLILGAETIARFVYGQAGTKQTRDICENTLGLPLFHHGGFLGAFKSGIRARLRELHEQAVKETAAA